MKNTNRITQLAEKIIPVLRKYQVSQAGLFGSVLRDDFQSESDVDVLVELDNQNITRYFDIKHELEEVLQRHVDTVQYSGLHRRIKNQVLSEQFSLQI